MTAPRPPRGSERWMSRLLVVLVGFLTIVVARRELLPWLRRDNPPVPAAFLLSGWEAARDLGLRIGPADAEVQIVEFVDVQCPACREMHHSLRRVLERYPDRVSLTLVHFPLPYNGNAVPGAIALECAAEQGRTSQMADALFGEQGRLGLRSWLEYARDANLQDLDRFGECLSDPARRQAIDAGLEIGRSLGVGYTPTLVLHGWVFERSPNAELLERTVDNLVRGVLPGPTSAIVTQIPGRSEGELLTISGEALAQLPRWELAPTPVWSVSDSEIPAIAGSVAGLRGVALASGRVAILSPYDAAIVVLGVSGRLEQVIGGYGQGPTQFGVILDIASAGGDSLVVLDLRNARIATIDAITGSIRTIPLPAGAPQSLTRVAGYIPGVGFLAHGFGLLREVRTTQVSRPLVPWGVFEVPGRWNAWTEVPDAETRLVETRYGGQRATEPVEVIWGARAAAAVSGAHVLSVESEPSQLVVRSDTGHVVRRFSVTIPRRAVTSGMREAVVRQRLDDLSLIREPIFDINESRRLLASTPFGDSLPVIAGLLPSPDGTVWAMEPIAPGDKEWRAIGVRPDGVLVGTVRGPAAVTPVAMGDRYVVGVSEAADGARLLGKWPLVPN